MLNLLLLVARKQDDLSGAMVRFEVTNKRAAFGARLIVKAEQRREPAIQKGKTLQPRGGRRQFVVGNQVIRVGLASASDVDLMAFNGPGESGARFFIDVLWNKKTEMSCGSCIHNGRDSGCLEYCSRLAAYLRISFSGNPPGQEMSVSAGRP